MTVSHGSTLPGVTSSGLNHAYNTGPASGLGLGSTGPMHGNKSNNSGTNLHDLHVLQSGGGGGSVTSLGSPHGINRTGSGGSGGGGSGGGGTSGVVHDMDYGFVQGGFTNTNPGIGGVGVGIGGIEDGWNDVMSGGNTKRNARDPHDVMEQYQSPSLSQEERFNMLLHQMKQQTHDSSEIIPGGGLGLGSGGPSPSQNNNGRGGLFDPLKWIN